MNIGIYTITDIVNNKLYVGSTVNAFNKRRNQHFHLFKINQHPNPHLQKIYNEFGKENLKFEILEECLSEYCKSQEQYWMNTLKSWNFSFGYNIMPTPNSTSGYRFSDEAKKKMAISQLKFRGKTSKEDVENHFKKKEIPKLTKEEVKDLLSKKNSGKGNPMYGKIAYPRKVAKLALNGDIIEMYISVMEASRQNNLHISRALKNGSTAGGYKWKYLD